MPVHWKGVSMSNGGGGGGETHLLEEHGHGRNNDALEHGPGLEQLGDRDELELERVPGRVLGKMGEQLGHAALLELRLGLDLEEFELDELIVLGQATQAGEHFASLFLTTVVDEPTRGKRHENHSDEENHSWEELKACGNQPRGVGLRSQGRSADEVGTAVHMSVDPCVDVEGGSQSY
jgi:hypothetical protein